ncbi:MAG: DUF3352 domain-containing protein [Candidatus Hinthialibacter antarcticus]|nr:DUF3352 domain-containing protein [Candidatus Hinthialibacter antarcticus]
MLKPIRLALLIIAVLTGSTAFSQQIQFDQIVPADIIFYMEGDASLDAEQAFPHFDEAMRQLGDTMNDVLEWRVLMDEWNAALESADIGDLEGVFGDRWCMAITGFGQQFNRIPTLIFISELKNEEQANLYLHHLLSGVASVLPALEVEEDFYDGLSLTSLLGPGRIPGLSLSYTVYENKLVLTTSKPLVIDLIEQFDYPNDVLVDDEDYQSIIGRLPNPHSWMSFMPVAGMVESVSNIAKTAQGFAQMGSSKGDDSEWSQSLFGGVQAGLNAVRAVRANGMASIVQEGGVKQTTTIVELDPERLDSFLAEIFEREQAAFPLQESLPRQTGSFWYSNVFNLKDLWALSNQMLATLPQGEKMKSDMTGFMNEIGVDIERDLLSWMGDSLCMVRPLADLNAVAPANHVALIIEANDEARLRQSLSKIQDAFVNAMLQFKIPIGVNEETHRGVAITSIGSDLPFVPVTPSWCIDEGRFILSTNVNFIREMIDVRNGRRPSIQKSRDYQALQDKILQPAHKIAFQDIASEFYTTRESLLRITSLTQLANDSNPDEIALAEAVIDRVAYWLGCMQIYRASAKQSNFSKEEIHTEKWVVSKDLRATPSTANIKRRPVSVGMEELVFTWAKSCAKRGDDERAVRLYQNLLKQRPAHLDYLTGLASAYQRQGNPQAAEEAYALALKTSPTASLLIAREVALGSSSADEIRQRIQSFAQANSKIDAAMVLFGVATSLRDLGRIEAAQSLLQKITTTYGQSPVAASAKFESQLLQNENTNEVILVPAINENDAEWSDAPSFDLLSPPNAKAMVAQSNDGLYVAIQLPGAEVASDEVEFRISLSPSRDYASRVDYSVMAHNSGDGWSILRQSANKINDDPFDFQLNATEAPSGDDILKTFQSIMKDLTKQEFDWLPKELLAENEPEPDEGFPWKASIEQDGSLVTLEAVISLEPVREAFVEKPVWLMNAAVGIETSPANDYLNYVPIRFN